MKKARFLPVFLISIVVGFISISTMADNSCTRIQEWIFKVGKSGEIFPVLTGVSLTDPVQRLPTAEGYYETTLSKDVLSKFKVPTIYIPAIGGLYRIVIDGRDTVIPSADYASVGPLVQIYNRNPEFDIPIQIAIKDERTSYAGFWKGAPILCEFGTASKMQADDTLWQKRMPSALAVVCLSLGILFTSIYFYTGRRFPIYSRFSGALFLWVPYFLVLSGTIREFSYFLGTNALLPARSAAALGLLLLFYSFQNSRLNKIDRLSVIGSTVLLPANIIFSYLGNFSLQVLCLGLSLIFQIPSATKLIKFRKCPRRDQIIASFVLFTITGETFDLFKFIGPSIGMHSPFPYLNRLTLPPTLFSSAAFFLWHFLQYFHQSRLNDFRHRVLGRLALRLARASLNESVLFSLARSARRLHFAYRSSIGKRNIDGNYYICNVSGFDPRAIGGIIKTEVHSHLRKAIDTGEITYTAVDERNQYRYRGDFSLVIPLPLRPNPDYLLLVSDLKKGYDFAANELCISRQFFTTLSSALIATQERAKADAHERGRQDLIKRLDPELYEFVQRNLENSSYTSDDTCERGVVYFDQKGYTTQLELIHPDKAALALMHIKKWVSECGIRYNARGGDFGGDAWLIEVFPLQGETKWQTISRTTRIAWDLCEGVDGLNRQLVSDGITPVNFRFGAHFGVAAKVNVDLVAGGRKTLIGDTVNIAQRIQAHAPAGTIYVSDTVAESMVEDFEFKPVEDKRYVKGRKGLVKIFRIVASRKNEREAA